MGLAPRLKWILADAEPDVTGLPLTVMDDVGSDAVGVMVTVVPVPALALYVSVPLEKEDSKVAPFSVRFDSETGGVDGRALFKDRAALVSVHKVIITKTPMLCSSIFSDLLPRGLAMVPQFVPEKAGIGCLSTDCSILTF